MAWFRSAEMEYVSIIVQDHVAHDTVQRLGDIGCFQFVDVSAVADEPASPHASCVSRNECAQQEAADRAFAVCAANRNSRALAFA